MPSDEFEALLEILAARAGARGGSLHDLEARRRELDVFDRLYPIPAHMEVTRVDAGGVPSVLVVPPDARTGCTVTYLHGGGYCRGSARSHGALAARIAAALGAPVLLPEYRLAPEDPFPAAVEDVVAVLAWLRDRSGPGPWSSALVGDSAGGGLALAAMVVMRDAGDPLPACAALLSPWVDLDPAGPAVRDGSSSADPVVTREDLELSSHWYLGGRSPHEPLASPVHADLSGLPPMLLQVGGDEFLLADSIRLEAVARRAGVVVELDVVPDMVHVWHLYAGVPEADVAVERIAAFIGRHWADDGPAPGR